MSVAAEPRPKAAVSSDPSVRRVLIYRMGSLGDTIVALPALHLIEQAFPNARRRMLTNLPVDSRAPAPAAVLEGSGLVHAYEAYPAGTRNPFTLGKLLLRLRRFRPDVAVYLTAETGPQRSRRNRRFLRWTGARRIVGVPVGGEVVAERAPDGACEPEAERLLRSLAELGTVDPRTREAWDLRLTSDELHRADAQLALFRDRPYFAVSIGTKVQAKDWGLQNWSALLRRVAATHPHHGLLLAGAPGEHENSARAAAAWSAVPNAGPVQNTCGALTPRESAGAFRHARAFLGHDSGPMHLAAAVGVPVVAIFAARNRPRTWFPYGTRAKVLYHGVNCAGCGLEICIDERKKCLLSITVQEVFAALHAILKGEESAT